MIKKMIKKAKNVLAFYNSLVYNNIVCRYSSSVECQLPKLERGVRFPLPAFFVPCWVLDFYKKLIHLFTNMQNDDTLLSSHY